MNALMIALHQKPVTVACWFLLPALVAVWWLTGDWSPLP